VREAGVRPLLPQVRVRVVVLRVGVGV
jgi:hypothetical protein